MDAVGKAIRSALEKGDAQDRAFREKVYRQAFAALERALEARRDLPVEEVRRRREHLKALIVEIESEFLPAAPPASAAPPEDEPAPAPAEEEAGFAPSVAPEDRLSAGGGEPGRVAPPEADRSPMAGPPRRRRPFAMLFVIATLVAAVGIGAWWTLESGILQSAEERDTAVRTAPGGEAEDFSPGGDAGAVREGVAAEGDWINLFSPDDPTTVGTLGGANAEALNEEGDTFLRVAGNGAEAAVSFDVGQGVLERLAGRRVIFSLTARAREGEETQISISCDFGALGDCGRSRYMVGPSPAEYLFEVSLPDRNPTAGGTVTVAPDIEGQGRALEIFSLRVAEGS